MQHSNGSSSSNQLSSRNTSTEILSERNFFTLERFQSAASGKSLGFFRYSTAGLNALYYSQPSAWDNPDKYPNSKICDQDGDYELDQILGNLMERTKALDESLFKDLQGGDGFQLSKSAFRELARVESGSGLGWQKNICIALLLDRLLWVKECIDNPDDPIPFPVQIPHDKLVEVEKGLEDLQSLDRNWPSTAVKFADAWQNRASTAIDTDALKSLYAGVHKSEGDMHIAKVTRNFCQVALAIRSTLIVSGVLFFFCIL
jgi:hypothetical protein